MQIVWGHSMHISKMELEFFAGKHQMKQIVIVTTVISKYNLCIPIVVVAATQV